MLVNLLANDICKESSYLGSVSLAVFKCQIASFASTGDAFS